MSFRHAHEQLRQARLMLNLQEDAERAEVEAAIARMRAEGERIIAESRPSIQPMLRKALDECQADYDEEREFGWACDPPVPVGV